MNKGNTKARITDETKSESVRLKTLWGNRKNKLSQVEFGEKYEIGSQSAMTQFLNGITPISMKAAIGFANGLGCEISDFSTRLAKEAISIGEAVQPDLSSIVAPVERLDLELSAGGGALADTVQTKTPLFFRKEFFEDLGILSKNAVVVKVRGDSMAPTFYGGSTIMIDREATFPRNGEVYAFVYDHELLVKRFFIEQKFWIARSDNPNFGDIVLDGSVPFRILGKAVWVAQRM